MSVDLTIYKTGNNVDAANRASINIKNNNEKTQKTGFDGVIVSGMEVDTKKLDKNTYTSLIKQADDVKSQIMQSASDAKANLKALFNRLSGADAVKIDEDGFNLNDATPDDCVNIIERIKIELAAHCDTYTGDMSGIDVSKIEKVVGSAGMAQQVAANMQDTGLPLTDDNISDMAESLSGMENGSLSEDTKNYLVKNNMQPTIKNIQIAQAASKGFGDKMQTLSRQELEQLMPQIKEIIGKAKLEVNDNNINNAITFISQDIPVTEQNLVYKNQLDMINLDYDETSLKIAQGMADGSKAEEVSLIKDYDSAVVIADAIDIVKNADYDAARDKQAQIEQRIKEIEYMLQNAEIISEEQMDLNVVKPGTTVTILDLSLDDPEEEKYTIVGSFETDPVNGKISNESPLAKALIGHGVNEIVTVGVAEAYDVKIVDIEFTA